MCLSLDTVTNTSTNVVFAVCRTGNHMAHVYGEHLVSLLNGCYEPSPEGPRRLFNCRHFNLAEQYGRGGESNALSNAKQWIERPWTTMQGPTRMEDVFGHATSLRDPEVRQMFMRCFDHVKGLWYSSAVEAHTQAQAQEAIGEALIWTIRGGCTHLL